MQCGSGTTVVPVEFLLERHCFASIWMRPLSLYFNGEIEEQSPSGSEAVLRLRNLWRGHLERRDRLASPMSLAYATGLTSNLCSPSLRGEPGKLLGRRAHSTAGGLPSKCSPGQGEECMEQQGVDGTDHHMEWLVSETVGRQTRTPGNSAEPPRTELRFCT